MKYNHITTKQISELKRLNQEGKNDVEIAELLGITYSTAGRWRRELGLKKARTRRNAGEVIYTIWDARTDELLACGTAKECTALLGFANKKYFYEMVCNTLQGRRKKYTVMKEVEYRRAV